MSVMTIKLTRSPGTPWGFRLQGGKDFATPLCIQKVNGGSVAAVAGLQAGDAIVTIGGKDALSLRHKEAQEAIVKAGNTFDLVVQRGAQTWKPQVTPLAQVKTTPEGVPVATKTSLAANKKPVRHIGSNHNSIARPFPGFTGDKLAYTHTTNVFKPPLLQDTGDGMVTTTTTSSNSHLVSSTTSNTSNTSSHPVSSTTSNSTSRTSSGSSSPGIPLAGTGISLSKENAKNFLMMTLDKENVNTINVRSNSPKSPPTSSSKSSSNENLFSTPFLNSSAPGGHQRKYSLASNASSCSSSEADHQESLTRRNNDVNGQQIVNAQYNTPLNLYSEDNIAETLSAQAEVLGKGCLGVNFMKNAQEYDASKTSDVLRMVQEMDKNPTSDSEGEVTSLLSPDKDVVQGYTFKILQHSLSKEGDLDGPMSPMSPVTAVTASGPGPGPVGTRSVRAPETKVNPPGAPSPVQLNKCSECERPLTGVFVRIKNKNLHADCFKCSTCGSSLKNVGYYNINEKLYCDVHAKQAARHHAPAPNMDPIIVKPGGIAPAGAMPAPTAKIASAAPEPVVALQPEPQPQQPPPQPPQPEPPVVVTVPEPQVQPPQEPEPQPEPEPEPECEPEPEPEPEPLPQEPVAAPPQPALITEPPVVEAVPAPEPAPAPVQAPPEPQPEPEPAPAPEPAPIPAPAPVPVQAPAAPMAAPPSTFTPFKVPAAPAPQKGPAPFGAPAAGVDVRTHISKKGIVTAPVSAAADRPNCHTCNIPIRGPFVSALGKTWCPDHFVCSTTSCRHALIDMGFVEEQGALHCEDCYEKYFAPICGKCDKRVKGDCLNAVGKQFHPECFCCAYCGKVFGSGAFYLEDGLPYCEADWNDLFTTKCVGCGFPIEAGDRWVEALNNNYHSQCFKCSKCNKNLEGQSFFAKGGKPFCKAHAQRGL